MTTQTAKFILYKNGLSKFTLRELSDLLQDRFDPLPSDVKEAIKILTQPNKKEYVI